MATQEWYDCSDSWVISNKREYLVSGESNSICYEKYQEVFTKP